MLDFIKELLASLKKTSTERISNPFYGVFIFTWLAFNWEAVAILLFSDLHMQERVRFINSAYPLMYIYPFISSVVLTFILPWCTEKITFFQSKSLSRTSSLLAIRKKKMLTADISVERFRAKKDVAYERYKVGAEKEVQSMKEEITLSTKRTGELTQERDDALRRLASLETQHIKAKNDYEKSAKLVVDYENVKRSLLDEINARKKAEEFGSDLQEEFFSINRDMQYYKSLLEENNISLYPSMTESMKNVIESFNPNKEKLAEAIKKIEELEIQKSFAQNAIGNPGFKNN